MDSVGHNRARWACCELSLNGNCSVLCRYRPSEEEHGHSTSIHSTRGCDQPCRPALQLDIQVPMLQVCPRAEMASTCGSEHHNTGTGLGHHSLLTECFDELHARCRDREESLFMSAHRGIHDVPPLATHIAKLTAEDQSVSVGVLPTRSRVVTEQQKNQLVAVHT
jgi:hypothetical protein